MTRSRILKGLLLHVALVLTGTVMVFWPTLRSGFDRMQTDPGDTWYLNYVLEHETRTMTQPAYVGDLWSPAFFHPVQNVLTYSENLLGTLPVYALLRVAFPPDTAYQVWCMSWLALCYATMAFSLRRLEISAALSGLGAFVFAYGLQRASHLGHGQLLPAAFAPLALLALVLHARAPSRRLFAGLLAASFLQVTAGVYLGWLLLLGIALFAVLVFLIDSDLRVRQLCFLKEHGVFVPAALLSWASAVGLFLHPYLVTARELPPRPWSDVLLLLPRPRSWIAAPTGSLWAKLGDVFPADTPLVWEHRLFLGAIPCLILLIGFAAVWRRAGDEGGRRTFVLAALGAVLILGLLSLRFPVKALGVVIGGEQVEYLSLWRFVYDLLPVATSIRAVGRVWTVILPLTLIGGFLGLELALGRLRSTRRRGWITASIVLFGVVEQYQADLPSFDKLEYRAEVSSVRAALEASGCGVGYVILDPSRPFYVSQLVAMWGGLEANVPVLNGYSGSFPPGYPDPTRSMTEGELADWSSRAPGLRLCVIEPPSSSAPRRVRLAAGPRE